MAAAAKQTHVPHGATVPSVQCNGTLSPGVSPSSSSPPPPGHDLATGVFPPKEGSAGSNAVLTAGGLVVPGQPYTAPLSELLKV